MIPKFYAVAPYSVAPQRIQRGATRYFKGADEHLDAMNKLRQPGAINKECLGTSASKEELG